MGEMAFQIHPDSHAALLHGRKKYGPTASVPEAAGPEEREAALSYPQDRLHRGPLQLP